MEKRKLLTNHLWHIQIKTDFLYFDNYHAGISMPKVVLETITIVLDPWAHVSWA